MMNAGGSNAALRQDYEFTDDELDAQGYASNEESSSETTEDNSNDRGTESEFGELDELNNEPVILTKSMNEMQKEIMDEHDGWLFREYDYRFSCDRLKRWE